MDRTPDKSGLSYWVSKADHGLSLHDIGNFFVGSQEFHNIYGQQLEPKAVVTGLYQHVLQRAPDTSGLNYWLDQISNGLSPADVVIYFAQSPENVALVAPKISGGIQLDLTGLG